MCQLIQVVPALSNPIGKAAAAAPAQGARPDRPPSEKKEIVTTRPVRAPHSTICRAIRIIFYTESDGSGLGAQNRITNTKNTAKTQV